MLGRGGVFYPWFDSNSIGEVVRKNALMERNNRRCFRTAQGAKVSASTVQVSNAKLLATVAKVHVNWFKCR